MQVAVMPQVLLLLLLSEEEEGEGVGVVAVGAGEDVFSNTYCKICSVDMTGFLRRSLTLLCTAANHSFIFCFDVSASSMGNILSSLT